MGAGIDNVYAMGAAVGTALITGIIGWLMQRAKKESDVKDEPIAEAVAKVQDQEDLRPLVDTLARRLGEMEAEIATYRTIVKVRYPLSLSVIRNYQQLYKDAGVHIPREIIDDL